MSKSRRKQAGNHLMSLFSLPFLSWSSGLSGEVGSTLAQQERIQIELERIAQSGQVDTVIHVIEVADKETIHAHVLSNETMHLINTTIEGLEQADVSDTDRSLLRKVLKSFF